MATMTKKTRSTVGDDILHGLRELAECIQAGHKPEDKFTVRVVEIPEPTSHTAGTVRTIRERLGVSQAAFAKLVGVSKILAQGWEQGVRVPSPLAGGVTKAAWTHVDATVEVNAKPGSPTRIYVGVDGVMAPIVTQAEKDKRRTNHAVRRQRRSDFGELSRTAAGLRNTKPLAPARPGSDESYKEMKIGLFYDQPKEHRHAFVTEKDCEAFGPLLKEHAAQVGFEKADESISLTDGAKWIVGQICRTLLLIKVMMLDFYHLATHIHAAAKCCMGDTPAAKQWAAARLKEIKESGAVATLAAIDALSKTVRAKDKRESLRLLRDYLFNRLEMLDYKTAVSKGHDIGSGPTEAMCKTLTLRLKRPGMKWDADHAAAMMNLTALYDSGQAKSYWASAA